MQKIRYEDEYSIIEIEVKESDPHISEFQKLCTAVALAAGYHSDNVEVYFPQDFIG